jgi:predicted nucleic acid-binding protein
MRVFMDASAWVAKAIATDQWAGDFRHLMRQLHGQRLEIVTSTWTLYEALAITRRRKPPATDVLFRDAINNGRVIRVKAEIEHLALQRFLKWQDKGASVVDHANALVAAQVGCDSLITFDEDFLPLAGAAGLRVLGRG